MSQTTTTEQRADSRPGWIHRGDLVVTLIVLALCGWLYYETTKFEEVSDLFAQDVPPAFFPRLLLWVIVALALLMPLERRLFGNAKRLEGARQHAIKPMTYWTIVLLVLLIVAIPWLGTYLALIGVCVLLPVLWGERRWLLLIPYAVIFPTVVMLLFAQFLQVYFEPGVLGLDFR